MTTSTPTQPPDSQPPSSQDRGAIGWIRWMRTAIILAWILMLPILATPWGQYHLDRWLGRTVDQVDHPSDEALPGPRWETNDTQ